MQSYNEATASVTFSMVSPKGFDILFSIREEDENKLVDKLKEFDTTFADLGFTAKPRRMFGSAKPEPKIIGKCPKCNGNILAKTTKDGKSFKECENRKYDFTTKTTSGCDYIEWEESQANDSPATPKQMEILKEKNLWEEGMTRSQASKKIGEVLGK